MTYQASKKTDFTVDLMWWGSLRFAPIIIHSDHIYIYHVFTLHNGLIPVLVSVLVPIPVVIGSIDISGSRVTIANRQLHFLA